MRYQLPLALLLASTTVACTTDEATTTETEVASALELENGGFDTSDEAPLFADDAAFAAAELEADRPIADPMLDDAEMRTLESAPGARILDVVVMWGHFRADPNAPTRHDWSGMLNVSRGALAAHRAIGFEDVMDRVLPRTLRDRIEFVSFTQPRTDGLALRVVDPRPAGDTSALRMTYTPRTQGASYELDLDALATAPVVVDLGDGNQIVAMARPHRDDCGNGFARGRWHAISPNASAYLGAVLNADGEIVGHMRGIAGQRRNGDQVFFGKWVNREGQFRGVLRGTYANGELRAKLIDRGGEEGVFHGAYRAGDTLRHGGFIGRWAETACREPMPTTP